MNAGSGGYKNPAAQVGYMRVADVMTPRSELVTATVPGSREDVLEILQERAFSSVPVVKETADGEVFRGLVSRERLIEDAQEEQLALLLEEIEPIEPDASIEALAAHMVATDARRVPVVDSGLDGIVTITDVVRRVATGDIETDVEVGGFADGRVHTAYAGTPLMAAERCLFFGREPYAVALDDSGEMVGIFTAVDILSEAKVVEGEEETGDSIANQDSEWAWEGIKAIGNRVLSTRNVELPDITVAEIMTEEMVTVSPRRTVHETARLMIKHDIEQIPVVRGDELIGIVKDMHLLAALYE